MLAERFPIPIVVGVWSAAGVVLMAVATLRWPDRQTVDDAITAAALANAAPPPSGPATRPATARWKARPTRMPVTATAGTLSPERRTDLRPCRPGPDFGVVDPA